MTVRNTQATNLADALACSAPEVPTTLPAFTLTSSSWLTFVEG